MHASVEVKVGIGERRKASLASRGYPDKAW